MISNGICSATISFGCLMDLSSDVSLYHTFAHNSIGLRYDLSLQTILLSLPRSAVWDYFELRRCVDTHRPTASDAAYDIKVVSVF